MKLTLVHIGAISFGKLLALWSFVLGLLGLILWTVASVILIILSLAAGTNATTAFIGLGIGVGTSIIGVIVGSVLMFIFGFIAAVIYNILLELSGGLDLDYLEREVDGSPKKINKIL